MEEELFRGTRPQVMVTNPDNLLEGRTFVWVWIQWFERIEGSTGAVAFEPVASSEDELRRYISQEKEIELYPPDRDYRNMVYNEFVEQSPLYPEALEVSSQPPLPSNYPVKILSIHNSRKQ